MATSFVKNLCGSELHCVELDRPSETEPAAFWLGRLEACAMRDSIHHELRLARHRMNCKRAPSVVPAPGCQQEETCFWLRGAEWRVWRLNEATAGRSPATTSQSGAREPGERAAARCCTR